MIKEHGQIKLSQRVVCVVDKDQNSSFECDVAFLKSPRLHMINIRSGFEQGLGWLAEE